MALPEKHWEGSFNYFTAKFKFSPFQKSIGFLEKVKTQPGSAWGKRE